MRRRSGGKASAPPAGTRETKKLIQWIFRRAGLHKSPFAADAEIYRNCGKLELALELRNHIRAALYDCDRTLFFQLTEEE